MYGSQWKIGNLQKFIGVYEKKDCGGWLLCGYTHIHTYIHIPIMFGINLSKILVNPRQTDGYMLTLGLGASVP